MRCLTPRRRAFADQFHLPIPIHRLQPDREPPQPMQVLEHFTGTIGMQGVAVIAGVAQQGQRPILAGGDVLTRSPCLRLELGVIQNLHRIAGLRQHEQSLPVRVAIRPVFNPHPGYRPVHLPVGVFREKVPELPQVVQKPRTLAMSPLGIPRSVPPSHPLPMPVGTTTHRLLSATD